MKNKNNALYLPGDKVKNNFGILIYLDGNKEQNNTHIKGHWLCFCGNEFYYRNSRINNNTKTDCGCVKQSLRKEKEKTRYLYNILKTIKQRCYNKFDKQYHSYGERGIKLFSEWENNYPKFIKEVIDEIGHRPTDNHQLDRKNNNKGYEPGNLRWATSAENNRNKNNNTFIEINGELKTIAEISEISGIKYNSILRRAKNGFTGEKLISPLRKMEYEEKLTTNVWYGIKSRCFDKKNNRFNRYGAKGITMYEPWINNSEKFLIDVIEEIGDKPTPLHTLDRKNNNGNYEPGNIRWATNEEQANNRSTTKFLTIKGETKSVSNWSKISGISGNVLRNRANNNWTDEDILSLVKKTNKKIGYNSK